MEACSVGLVVPAFNEEHTLPRVLDTLYASSWLSQIVIVNDGSTDRTAEVAQAAAAQDSRISVRHQPVNRGKGAALVGGLQALRPEIGTVIFLDADLLGLRPDHLRHLHAPIAAGECEMSVAIFRHGHWRTDAALTLSPQLSGQRCLPRAAAEAALEPLASSGYGVEMGLTVYAEQHAWRIAHVDWDGVTHVMKEDKRGLVAGLNTRLGMYREILKTWVRARLRDRSPR